MRLNKPLYPQSAFTDHGIAHTDIIFADGSSNQTEKVADRFLKFMSCPAVRTASCAWTSQLPRSCPREQQYEAFLNAVDETDGAVRSQGPLLPCAPSLVRPFEKVSSLLDSTPFRTPSNPTLLDSI